MKNISFSLFYCFVSMVLNAQKFEHIETFEVSPLEIECSIIHENAELDYYEISWSVPPIDSIAKAKGELPRTELHCFVYDSSGIIGFYKGLSTPLQYCTFQTKDSIVEVFFRLRRVPYASYTQDSTEIIVSNLRLFPFDKTSHRGPEYESIQLAVNSTKNRKLILLNDTNTVRISYGTHSKIDSYDPVGSVYSGVITLDRYYLSLRTGRIASGQKWINKKGPKEIVRNSDDFLLIIPKMKYIDKNNNQYLGSELIQAGRVKLKKFNIVDFVSTDKENIPY